MCKRESVLYVQVILICSPRSTSTWRFSGFNLTLIVYFDLLYYYCTLLGELGVWAIFIHDKQYYYTHNVIIWHTFIRRIKCHPTATLATICTRTFRSSKKLPVHSDTWATIIHAIRWIASTAIAFFNFGYRDYTEQCLVCWWATTTVADVARTISCESIYACARQLLCAMSVLTRQWYKRWSFALPRKTPKSTTPHRHGRLILIKLLCHCGKHHNGKQKNKIKTNIESLLLCGLRNIEA